MFILDGLMQVSGNPPLQTLMKVIIGICFLYLQKYVSNPMALPDIHHYLSRPKAPISYGIDYHNSSPLIGLPADTLALLQSIPNM